MIPSRIRGDDAVSNQSDSRYHDMVEPAWETNLLDGKNLAILKMECHHRITRAIIAEKQRWYESNP